MDQSAPTFKVNAALKQYVRVKFSSGKLVAAAKADDSLGPTAKETFAADELVAVNMESTGGTRKYIANNAITQYALVYTADDGEVSSTSTGATKLGIALDASTADGDIIRVALL